MFRALACAAFLFAAPAWGATPITAGTDLSTVLNSSGEYELQAGTHTASTFTIAANVALTSQYGSTLVVPENVILEYRDGFSMVGMQVLMATGSQIKAEAESGDTYVDGALLQENTFRTTGTITTAPRIYIGQGFNSYHRNIVIKDNDFWSIVLLEEVGDRNKFTGNFFYEMTGLRPLQWWGSNHLIAGNYVNGGIFGITALGKHNIAAGRRPCTGNRVESNVVLNTSEEGISFDVVGNVATETVLREYDTVASKPGGSVINLASANWSAQTTYTGSVYDAVFVSGTLAGQRFKITTHSGAAFTLSGLSDVYASVTVGDGVSVQLSCYDNTIANNISIPLLAADRAHTSGIVLHGTGVGMRIYNNIAYGENDGVGAGEGGLTNFAIRETSLNSITAGTCGGDGSAVINGTRDSITCTQRRGPVGLNSIYSNRHVGGGIGSDYKNYGGASDYTPPPSTYTDNQASTRAAIGWVGGTNPTTAEGFRLSASSSLAGAGVANDTADDADQGDYFGDPWPRPSIGAFQ